MKSYVKSPLVFLVISTAREHVFFSNSLLSTVQIFLKDWKDQIILRIYQSAKKPRLTKDVINQNNIQGRGKDSNKLRNNKFETLAKCFKIDNDIAFSIPLYVLCLKLTKFWAMLRNVYLQSDCFKSDLVPSSVDCHGMFSSAWLDYLQVRL